MIKANRFLRGMVRMLTAVQLKVARGSISMQVLEDMFRTGKCPWSAPAEGLYLKEVAYPAGVWLTGL
jgi:tRNA pseudouridine38-40 synthase